MKKCFVFLVKPNKVYLNLGGRIFKTNVTSLPGSDISTGGESIRHYYANRR